jgi:hypothetical protein
MPSVHDAGGRACARICPSRSARDIDLTPPTSERPLFQDQLAQQETLFIANLLSRAQRFHESVQLIFDGIIRILRLPKQGFGFLLI